MIRRTNDKQAFQLTGIASVLSFLFFPPKLMYLVQKILSVARTATGWPAGAPLVYGKNSADYRFRPRYLTNHLARVTVLRASSHTHFVPKSPGQLSGYGDQDVSCFDSRQEQSLFFPPPPPSIQTSAGAHQPSYRKGTRKFCLGVKAAGD
jgi:hypothetical protein